MRRALAAPLLAAAPAALAVVHATAGVKATAAFQATAVVHATAAAGAADPNMPPTAAERIAGRWRITVLGLASDHQDLLASLAVDGDLLLGTLTAGQETIGVTSGKVVGTDFSFAFRHPGGDDFRMRGSAGERGLQGTWEGRGERGRWKGERLR